MFKFGTTWKSVLGSGRRYKHASSSASNGGSSARGRSTYPADPFDPDCLDDAGKTGEPAPTMARGVIAPAALFSAPAAQANASGTAAAAKAPAKAAAETAPAKKAKAASTKHPVTVVLGTRVRVRCDDRKHYEGTVNSWDAAAGEWKIVLDDGGAPLSPARACFRLARSLHVARRGAARHGAACDDGAARAIERRR
jgi:hypothetical protein